jgi:hypothetical protein
MEHSKQWHTVFLIESLCKHLNMFIRRQFKVYAIVKILQSQNLFVFILTPAHNSFRVNLMNYAN